MKQTFQDEVEFEEYCGEVLEAFIDGFRHDPRFANHNSNHSDFDDWPFDEVGEGDFVLTPRGQRLYERYVGRLADIGYRLFPDGCLSIKANGLYEP